MCGCMCACVCVCVEGGREGGGVTVVYTQKLNELLHLHIAFNY